MLQVKTMEAKIYQQELWNPDDFLEGARAKKAVGMCNHGGLLVD